MTYFDYLILFVLFLGSQLLSLIFKSYLPKFAEEKGKNLATKQDITGITEQIEKVKSEISQNKLRFDTKFRLKYDACLKALSILDANISHYNFSTVSNLDSNSIDKQFSDIKTVRNCCNQLMISCDNNNIPNAFRDLLMIPPEEQNKFVALDEFRNLVRRELGFGDELSWSSENTWIGGISFHRPQK